MYHPGYVSPGYVNPGYVSPGYVNPGYVNPGYVSPGYVNPGYVNPGYVNPGYVNPGYMYVKLSYILVLTSCFSVGLHCFSTPLPPPPSPLFHSQTSFDVPLDGQSAVEDLMESFGFGTELTSSSTLTPASPKASSEFAKNSGEWTRPMPTDTDSVSARNGV